MADGMYNARFAASKRKTKDGKPSYDLKVQNVGDEVEEGQTLEVNAIRKDGEERPMKCKIYEIGEDRFGDGNYALGTIVYEEGDQSNGKGNSKGKGKAKKKPDPSEDNDGETGDENDENEGSELDEDEDES